MKICDHPEHGAARKPEVWWDEDGWTCDQTMYCPKCKRFTYRLLADNTTWAKAIRAGIQYGQPVRHELAAIA